MINSLIGAAATRLQWRGEFFPIFILSLFLDLIGNIIVSPNENHAIYTNGDWCPFKNVMFWTEQMNLIKVIQVSMLYESVVDL